jgi:lipooligosaccharide transport system permease protein
MAESAARPPKLGRLERQAMTGVLVREIVNYSSYWRSATFSATVEPTIYLLAFGFGFGSLVSQVAGYDYVEFVGTGTVATAVLFSSAFAAMFGTFIKYQFQHTYDAILAAPVDTEELVTAEALWIAARAGVYGCVPLLVAIVFGLDPAWGMLTVPFIGFLAGFGWACFGIMISGFAKSIENFNYVISAVLTPLFLVAGTFFPLSGLPPVGADRREPQPASPLRRARSSRCVRLGRVDRPRARWCARRLRPRDVAHRHLCDGAQARRLAS